MGKGYVEIRPRGVHKGVMLDHIVSLLYSNSGGVDFVSARRACPPPAACDPRRVWPPRRVRPPRVRVCPPRVNAA